MPSVAHAGPASHKPALWCTAGKHGGDIAAHSQPVVVTPHHMAGPPTSAVVAPGELGGFTAPGGPAAHSKRLRAKQTNHGSQCCSQQRHGMGSGLTCAQATDLVASSRVSHARCRGPPCCVPMLHQSNPSTHLELLLRGAAVQGDAALHLGRHGKHSCGAASGSGSSRAPAAAGGCGQSLRSSHGDRYD